MDITKKFKEGWEHLKAIVSGKVKVIAIIGPFNASIYLQGEQRGIFIPKGFHDKEWFLQLLNKKKNKVTIIIEEID